MKLGVQQHRRQYLVECDFLPLDIYLYIGHIWCGPGASAQYVPTATIHPLYHTCHRGCFILGPEDVNAGPKIDRKGTLKQGKEEEYEN
jgi:hypothetical protein